MIPSHVGGLVIGGAAVTHNDDIVIAKRDVASAAACEQAVRTKVTVEYDDIGKFRAWAVVYKTYQELVNAVLVEIYQKITLLLALVLKIIRYGKISEFLLKAVLDPVAVILKCRFIPFLGCDLAACNCGNECQQKDCCEDSS